MKKNGLDIIFYGLLFVLINIPVGGIDLLPDFIGYILLYTGFVKLRSAGKYFDKAGKYLILLFFISLVTFYRSVFMSTDAVTIEKIIPELILSVISFIFTMIIFYDLFHGIKKMAEKQKKSDISSEAISRWKQFMVLYILSMFLVVMVFIKVPDYLYVIGSVILVLYIYVVVKIMTFIKKCSRTLDTEIKT